MKEDLTIEGGVLSNHEDTILECLLDLLRESLSGGAVRRSGQSSALGLPRARFEVGLIDRRSTLRESTLRLDSGMDRRSVGRIVRLCVLSERPSRSQVCDDGSASNACPRNLLLNLRYGIRENMLMAVLFFILRG